jgi:23S rRNA (cytosine1962-C5)-methyltransferase
MTRVRLRRKIGHRVLNGHPWIFGNEVQDVEDDVTAGDIVLVETHDGKFVGQGYINPQSQILVRLLTRKKADVVNADFFLNRIRVCHASER